MAAIDNRSYEWMFVLTFVVYFFNLDMKLTAALEPLFVKHYDKVDRDKHL